MTQSIFDPNGGETEHSGGTFTGPRADNESHMPTSVTDGEVSDEEVAEHEDLLATEAETRDRAIGQTDLGVQSTGSVGGDMTDVPGLTDPIVLPPRRGNEGI